MVDPFSLFLVPCFIAELFIVITVKLHAKNLALFISFVYFKPNGRNRLSRVDLDVFPLISVVLACCRLLRICFDVVLEDQLDSSE